MGRWALGDVVRVGGHFCSRGAVGGGLSGEAGWVEVALVLGG